MVVEVVDGSKDITSQKISTPTPLPALSPDDQSLSTPPCVVPSVIREGQHVILKNRGGAKKAVLINPNETYRMPRVGNFKLGLLVGLAYGQTLEVLSNTDIRVVDADELNHCHLDGSADIGDSSQANNNQNINDISGNQRLSDKAIEEMKKLVASGEKSSAQLINDIVQNSKSFDLKTDFSKSKYLNRKKVKFDKTFTVLRPTPSLLSQMYCQKNPEKILHLRHDTLSYMVSVSDLLSNGKYLVVDDASGLLISSVIQACGAGFTDASILGITKMEPKSSWDCLRLLGCSFKDLNGCHYLSWKEVLNRDSMEYTDLNTKRKVARDSAYRFLDEGQFDGLIVATAYNPTEVVQLFYKYIAPGRQIVMYNKQIEPLTTTFRFMRQNTHFLNVELTENWLREYQVLPQRTHPNNHMSNVGGYVLTATTVLAPMEEGGKDKDVQKRVKLEESVADS